MQFHFIVIDKKKNIQKNLQIHHQNQLRNYKEKHISTALSLLMFHFPNIYLLIIHVSEVRTHIVSILKNI